jgi:hypothetical protein
VVGTKLVLYRGQGYIVRLFLPTGLQDGLNKIDVYIDDTGPRAFAGWVDERERALRLCRISGSYKQ